MASINLDKVRNLYGNSTNLQGQFIDYLRNVESELDFSKFEGLDNQAIFTNLMESGQKEIKVNPNNPAKPLDYRPRREQTYKALKALDDELKNQPFYKDLAMHATQVLDQINPTPFRQKELETRRQKAQEILNHLKRSGVTSEQFAKEYGDSPFLREAYFENQDIFSNIFDLSHDTSAALFGGKNAQAKAYDFELESYNTYKTIAQRKLDDPSDYYKLTPQERKIIEQRVGAIGSWWRNNSDKELVDYYLDLENAKESASNFVAAQKRLENVNSNEQFLGLIGALKHGKEFDKKQKAMIDDYAIVAKELGFDTLAYNKTGLYFIKDEKAYKVEQGLWDEIKGVFKDNIGSLAGAIAGAEYGYKKGKLKGMVAYGAAGAFGGGVTDSMIADVLANKKIDLAQALIHGAQEGALNIAADAVLKVAGTAIKTLNPEKLKNIAGTAIDYTPLLGFAKRAKDGNKAAAQKLIDHAIPQEAQADLKALESIFGAEVQIGTTKTSQAQNAINALQNKLGSDSYIVKGAQSLYDTFAFTSQKQAQKDFIRAIRADESGNLTAFLSEAANASPVIQKNLLNILDQTSQKLANQLERFELPPSTIKDVFDNFEKGTKQSYTDAIEQILLKVYDESYTTTLAKDSPNIPSNLSEQEAARFNTDSLESFKAKMEKSGMMLEDSAKFLRFVESTIYNPKGVTFETLNNAQKTLNAYYKQASDPNFRSFVKDAINGFIKRDIQAGIEAIFAQNKALYNDARTLFDTALSDYAKMKETLKLADSLKIRDRRRSYEQVAQSLSRFFLGQGENIPNFEALLGSLQKELREQVELKLLQDMLELSFVKLNDIKVLDSSEFFKRLEPLKGHFHSTSAKDFIKIAQDFHTLFRNDANIAKSLSPATTEKIGTSIATTLEGAVKFQVIKALFANIIRLMPYIPFAKRLNESVQGSALRYQLKKALDSSLSVGEFKLELQARAIKADFNNATREQIAKILGQVDHAQESLERAPAQPPLRADEIGEAKQGEATDSLAIHKTDIQETQAPKVETSKPSKLHPITSQEATELAEHFHFKGAKPLVREARENEITHALKSHGDEATEAQRGNIAITRADINENYPKITQDYDEKFYTDNGIIYVKQVNGHHITIEEALLGQDKLIFKTMWKTKGNYNKEVLLKNAKASPYPHNADEAVKSESISSPSLEQGNPLQSHQSISDSTTKSPLEQAHAQKQAKKAEQEAAKQAQAQADQNTAQAIKDRNDQIQNLKDSRAGKSEMEREVKLGQPIAMKRPEHPPTSIATDDNNIYQLDFVVVKASDVKPNFNADGLQPRTQKEHKTIESIAQNFKPEMVLGRGGYKDLPIIAKDGQVITGNHRVQGFKDFTQESRASYQKAIKDRFNIELASDELLLRTPSDDLSVKELLSIAYNSNKEDIKNLGDHIYSVLGRYAPNFDKLPRQLESSSVQELKSKIARILDPSPYPNENDANLALLANTIKADKNANITEMLNAFSKLDKEDADRTLSTFTDTAGLWHILSNNAVEYGLKQLDLRPYLLGAMYKSATSQHTTRAANFKELNTQIKHILDTTDSSGSNAMLVMMPNTYDNLIADLLGASLARFMRLENPSSNLYEALKGANSGIREQLAPRLDFETGWTTGKNISEADIFDFIEYMIRQGDAGREVNEAVELLPKLREKYNAFKASTTPPNTPTPPTPPKVDSSVETKELHTKTTSKLTKDELDNLPIATAQEYGEFLEKIAQKDYQNTPEILKIATLNSDLQELINNNHSASVFITRARAGHISEARKGEYDQALTLEEQKQIPAEIAQAKQAYTDDKSGFILPFADKNNSEKINLIILDSDSKGNFLITAKKVNSAELNNPKYKKLARAGVEPATTTPPKAEQKPTEAISLARDEIIPQQTPQDGELLKKEYHRLKKEYDNLYNEKTKQLNKGLNPTKEQMRQIEKAYRALSKVKNRIFKEITQPARDFYVNFLTKYGNKSYFESLRQPIIRLGGKEELTTAADEIDSLAQDLVLLKQDLFRGIPETKIDQEFARKTRLKMEKAFNIKPIAEFGENYAEHYRDGKGAIEKLLLEKQGQVSGAFYRKELGDIDLVWGEVQGSGKEAKGWGLAKIIEKHGDEFENIAKELDKIIRDGEVVKTHNGYNIELGDYKVGLNIGWNENGVKIGENKWVVTAFDKSKLQSEKQGSNSASLTKGETLPFNSSDIIPQSHTALSKQAQDHARQILQGLRKTAQTPLNKLADEVHSTDRKFMLREARYIKQQAQEFADNFANLRWQDLRAAIRYAKVPYDEAMFKELKESIESREFARFIESSYPPKPLQKSLFDTQELTPPKVDSTPTPSQPPQAQKLKEALQIPLTDDRGLQSLAFGRVGSDAEIMEQVLIPQARNAYRKGTSQNKLEVAARNALKKHRQDLEQSLNITPIKEFGINYAEHYHSGESAIQKLLLERNGQVAGAFYREGIGDITLAWGEKGTGKSDGWGLSKIAEYHPEVLDKLDKLIQDLPIVKETENRYKLDNGDFFISIRKDFEGQKQNWVL